VDRQKNKKLTPEGIRKILEFLPLFKSNGFETGKWHTSRNNDENDLTLPCYEYSELVGKFIQTLYDEGFIYPFDWSKWNYGIKLSQNNELMQKANLLNLRKLVTAHVRQDRFCEGHLASLLENGIIVKILERIQQIFINLKK